MALIAAALGCVGMIGRAAADDAADFSCMGEERRPAEIAEVIDGDTVRLAEGTVVRLAGIEAPKRPLGRPHEEDDGPLTDAARDALADLVRGHAVRLVTIGKEADRYGRIHAHLVLHDGTWVQAALLQRGVARLRGEMAEMACFSVLAAPEAAARAAGRGLWRAEEYAVRAADDPSLPDRKGLYEIVEGRVLSVGHGRRMIFIDFGSDYRRDFTIMVRPALAERFAEAGMDVEDLRGQRVRVRGVIEESGGPAIRISHPAELELLDDRYDAAR